MSEIGRKFRQNLSIGNSRSHIMLVMLEPWGEDYWLLPGESFYIKVESTSGDFWYHTQIDKEYTSVCVDGDYESVCVMQNDEVLECGHNRPTGAFA